MPRKVDHEQRRAEVVELATDLVSKGGLDALTVRDVARAGGYSTSVVSHYFTDKRHLLLATYRAAIERSRRRTDQVRARNPGDFMGCIDVILPLDAERRRDWQVWSAFWGMAVADPAFEAEQREGMQNALVLFEEVFEAARKAGAIPPNTNCKLEARRCVTLLNGIAIGALFDSGNWSPDQQRDFIAATLGRRITG